MIECLTTTWGAANLCIIKHTRYPRIRDAREETMARTRILLLNTSRAPILVPKTNPRALRPFTPPDTVIEVSWPRRWYSTIGDEASFGRTVPHVMEQVDRHKKDYDAIVVNHHSDGGIEALRVMVDVPVVGMGEAIVWMAAYLVERFSMVTMYEGNRRLDRKVFHKMGLSSRLASLRVPEAEIRGMEGDAFEDKNLPATAEIIAGQCVKCVVEDGAEAVILGGSLMGYFMPDLPGDVRRRLAAEGHPDVPVIEPMATGLHLAKMLVDLGLRRLP